MENKPQPQSSRLDWGKIQNRVEEEPSPEFKGKFLVCIRQTMVYDDAKSRFVLQADALKPFKDLERDKYVLFSRN